MSSFKAEMLVEGQWSSNALRFRTRRAAELYAADLFARWTMPTDKRVVASDDPPSTESTTVDQFEGLARK